MSLSDFITKYNNQSIKSPHGIQGQCVSVSSLWAVENNWQELSGDTALHIYQNFNSSDYLRVPILTGPTLQPGDIIFWDSNYGGGAGHTGVVTKVWGGGFTCFEQNDPTGTPAHEANYTYKDVIGWFHPKGLDMDTVTKQDVDNLLPLLLPTEPVTQDSYNLVGKSFHDFIYYVVGTQAFQDDVAKLKNNTDTVLGSGRYIVK